MRIFNINLHCYPEPVGGAAVVAEKLGAGLSAQGHDVTNIYLSQLPGGSDFVVTETPFGRSIGLNHMPITPANRFSNPAATSLLFELYDVLRPDRIFVHAVQHMGMLDFLSAPEVVERSRLIAHDAFWTCLQGFRTLPDGSPCNLQPSAAACRQCAWFPGLTDRTYATMHDILSRSRAVIFPSQYLHDLYIDLLGGSGDHFVVQSNPDTADMLFDESATLPAPAAAAEKDAGKTVFGYVGGPGDAKGWGLVRDFMQAAAQEADTPNGPHVVLFDIGRNLDVPWYDGMARPGTTIADPFHWSYAAHALQNVHVMLMPSRVRESFGLAAREILSLGGTCVIRPSGALSEMQGYRGVATAAEGDTVEDLTMKLSRSRDPALPAWRPTPLELYTERLMSL